MFAVCQHASMRSKPLRGVFAEVDRLFTRCSIKLRASAGRTKTHVALRNYVAIVCLSRSDGTLLSGSKFGTLSKLGCRERRNKILHRWGKILKASFDCS
eukprot:1519355-Amphidinium_carterae.1